MLLSLLLVFSSQIVSIQQLHLYKRVTPKLKSTFLESVLECNERSDDEYYFHPPIFYDQPDANICNRWQTLSILGEGGNGHVVKVKDHKTNHLRALKVTYKHACQHDAEIYSHLGDMLHIVPLLETHYISETSCIQLFPLMAGDVYNLLEKQPNLRLPLPQIRVIARETLSALAYLHDREIVHNDIKPDNIFYEPASHERMRYKLADFGLSFYKVSNSLHPPGGVEAPECSLGLPFSTKSDIWSLGITLLELYTGLNALPFKTPLERLYLAYHTLKPSFTKESRVKTALFAEFAKRGLFNPRVQNPAYQNVQRMVNFEKPLSFWIGNKGTKEEEEFLSLLTKMLQFDPALRISAQEAVNHRFLLG